MKTTLGIALVLIVIAILGLTAYFITSAKKHGGKRKLPPKPEPIEFSGKPRKVKSQLSGPKFEETIDGKINIPPEIPKTLDTIKVMADEDVSVVVAVVKKWLHTKKSKYFSNKKN